MSRELVQLVIKKEGSVFDIFLIGDKKHFNRNEMLVFALAIPIECGGVRGYRLLRNYRAFLPELTSDTEAKAFQNQAMSFFECVFTQYISNHLPPHYPETRRALDELMQNSKDVFGCEVLPKQEVENYEENFTRDTNDWFESRLINANSDYHA